MVSTAQKKVALIAGFVYFSQGALGVSAVSLPLFLRGLNWSITEITSLSSLVALPWVLKILYGIISDSFPFFGYRRKSYLLLCAGIGVLGWLAMSWVPGTKGWIFFALTLANLGFAATDVITDGLIVENSTPETSPIFQGIAWGTRSVGAIISGVAGGWLAAHWEARHVFMLTAALPLTVLAVGWIVEEPKKHERTFRNALEPLTKCWKLLLSSDIKWFIAFLIVISAPASFGTPFFFHMKENLAFDEKFLGLLMSLGWSGALIGSLIYMRWLKSVSPKKILYWAVAINSFNILCVMLIQNVHTAFWLVSVGGILGCIAILPMMSSSAVLTHNTGVEGTMFAILMSVYNLSQITLAFLGGKLFNVIGLYPLIVGSAILVLPGFYFISKLKFENISRST